MDYKTLVLAATSAALLAGCASVDPRNTPQTDYDKTEMFRIPEEDVPIFKKLIKSEKKSISLCVNTDPVAGQIDVATAGQGLQAELQSALDSLGFLRTVSANDDLLSFMNAGYGGDAPQDLPDYILLCKLTYVSSVKDAAVQTIGAATTAGLGIGTLVAAGKGNTTTALGMGGATVAAGAATATMVPQKVNIRTYFELYDREAGATIYSRTIAKEEAGVANSGIGNSVQRLFSLAAKEYMEQVASKIGPVGQVLKTTGGGKYAYISLGSDAGLAKDGYVQFLKKEQYGDDDVIVSDDGEEEGESDNKKIGRKETIDFESVTEGRVAIVKPTPLLEGRRAWIEVLNFDDDNPLVKRGMPVRIVPVPRKGGWLSHIGIGGPSAD
jgi:hypothetical protein